MEILLIDLCSLLSNPCMAMLVCLRWAMVSPANRSARRGIMLTIDPLLAMILSGRLAPEDSQDENRLLWSSILAYFSSSEKEIIAKHASRSGVSFHPYTLGDLKVLLSTPRVIQWHLRASYMLHMSGILFKCASTLYLVWGVLATDGFCTILVNGGLDLRTSLGFRGDACLDRVWMWCSAFWAASSFLLASLRWMILMEAIPPRSSSAHVIFIFPDRALGGCFLLSSHRMQNLKWDQTHPYIHMFDNINPSKFNHFVFPPFVETRLSKIKKQAILSGLLIVTILQKLQELDIIHVH